MNKREQQIATIAAVASAVVTAIGMAILTAKGEKKPQEEKHTKPMTFRELYEDNAIDLDSLTH